MPDASSSLVQLDALTKTYREGEQDRTVLQEVSLRLERGDFSVLMGRSGAGKSTLLNLVSGIDQPTSGRVQIGDTDLTGKSETERTRFRRSHVGFVFQSFNLISTLTVGENVRLPLELAGEAPRATKERARAMLDRVGLADRADQFPDRLSGGEQQRVAVARALAHQPLLVLADEPTGNLDYDTGQAVLTLLSDLVVDTDTTLLVATHDPEVLPRADRVLHLHGGTLHEEVPEYITSGT
ncbi:putative ABC transport system ATP-binding protein [Salinibacter ruber]|uniref:ABC transport system ATP-binding protein n=1 Tax=Salinibacter ruber TaxID=146919 RepID=A0AAW5P453_9BACT|nr:ABC transporter ATP-binding protein [Salinibacter ruber]MCS3664179.1 putative ABC transport system ATP-binding protein [Salinibacter ruber]MCS4156658.1 putative ABC transport system ATP-binding protein [Salinibacter ruber]MCS4222601.1 putative ABC transport system ATP-binding protein [Salinibacter ruber]